MSKLLKNLKQQLIEKNNECRKQSLELQQIYSHLGIETYGSDIQEQAITEIDKLKQQLAEKVKEIDMLKQHNESLSNKFDKGSDMQNKIDILTINNVVLERQLRAQTKEIVEKIKERLRGQVDEMSNEEHCYLLKAVHWEDVVAILTQILKDYDVDCS